MNASLTEVLSRVPNPFSSAIVRDPWKNDDPDVGGVNHQVSEHLVRDLARVQETGDSRGVVITGSAGAGKTHLLSRLRRSEALREQAFLVEIPPLVGRPDEFAHHLLAHTVSSLQRATNPGAMPQIRRLFVSFAKEVVPGLERGRLEMPRDQFKEVLRTARAALDREAPRAHPEIIRAFGAYMEGGTHEQVACDWLRGYSLDQDDLTLIGLENSIKGEDAELRALEALTAMARLGTPRRAVVFAFDQIDAYAGSDRLRRFAEIVTELVHQRNHLVLSFCLQSTWEELQHAIPEPMLHRMHEGGGEPYLLGGLSRSELEQVLRARLDAALSEHARPHALWPLETADLDRILSGAPAGRVNPRQALFVAQRIFEERRKLSSGANASPADQGAPRGRAGETIRQRPAPFAASAPSLTDIVRARLAAARAEPPPVDDQQTRGYAEDALRLAAKVRPAAASEPDIDLVVDGGSSVGLAFIDSKDAREYRHRMQRLLELAHSGTLDRIVVVRDRRSPISGAAEKTQAYWRDLSAGTRTAVFWIDPEVIGELRGMRQLADAAASGDLAYAQGDELHSARVDDVTQELKRCGALEGNAFVAFVLGLAGAQRERAAIAEVQTFTVSQLRNAVACPRLFWFDLQQKDGHGTTWIRTAAPSIGRAGATFHQLVARFLGRAARDDSVVASVDAGGDERELGVALLADFYDEEARGVLSRFPGDAARLQSAIQSFCGLLAGLITAGRKVHPDARRLLDQVIVAQEEPLEATFGAPEFDVPARLIGRCDAILHDVAAERLLLVEYKLSSSESAREDAMQAAAYSLLLQRMTGVRAAPVVARFEDGLDLEEFSSGDAASLEQSVLERLLEMQQWARFRAGEGVAASPPASPDLCRVCPYDDRCDATLGRRRPIPQPPPQNAGPPRWVFPDAEDEARSALDRAVAVLANFKLDVDPAGFTVGPTFIRLALKPRAGVKVTSIRNRAEDLKVALELHSLPYLEAGPGYVSLDVPRRQRNPVTLEETLAYAAPLGDAWFPLGVGVDGKVTAIDLAEPNTCHLLVGGGTGSGKSELLRSILCGLAAHSSPAQLQMSILDPKLVTFTSFAGSPYLRQRVATDIEAAATILDELVEEVDRRYRRMEGAGVSDLPALRLREPDELLPRHVVVFDELADFMQDPEGKRLLESSVKRLGAKARAAGVHLILATQRPDRTVVTGLIKANLPCRIGLLVSNRTNSQVILDESGAEALLGKGDLLARYAGTLVRLQAPLTEETYLRRVLRLS